MNLIALFDLDGSLADFDKSFKKHWRLIDPHTPLTHGPSKTQFLEYRKELIKKIPGFWRNLEKIELGFAIKHWLQMKKFSIHVCTAASLSNPNCWKEKIEWCGEHLPYIPVTITRDKGLIYGHVLVDDWPEYIFRWLEHRPRGLVICPAQPWNEGIEHERLVRVSSMKDRPMVDAAIDKRLARIGK